MRYPIFLLLMCGMLGAPSNADEPLIATKNQISDFLSHHCADCHGSDDAAGGLDVTRLTLADLDREGQMLEDVLRKLRTRQMPPVDVVRPSEDEYNHAIDGLTIRLGEYAEANPNPGRPDSLRRLNRTEYQNAIRDLLALDVDAQSLLPPDESSHGFDNVTVGELSPTLLSRYVSAAQKISRLAVGSALRSPGGDTIRLKPDFTQEEHVDGLPVGTRGGALIKYTFPQDGQYDIQLRLARDRNEHVEGLGGKHELELLVDNRIAAQFTIRPPRDQDHSVVDAYLKARIAVTAGPHDLGITFPKNPSSLIETMRQPFDAHFNMHRHPRISPAIYQVSITGPYAGEGPGDTPSRDRIFVCRPEGVAEEPQCAERILRTVMRRAYRRPVDDQDLAGPMAFYTRAREAGGSFEQGIESALSSVLVSPQFLFRVEQDPADVEPGQVYRLSDLELASRLAFFLWSSIPDDELLDLAIAGTLSDAEVLEQQVRRMLSDVRSTALVTNFAAQWLYLRNLESITPDMRLFPDFDDNLRQAFRTETELFLQDVMREDRSVLDLLQADYTYLNQRLAKHYDIPHVYGSRFRRVQLDDQSHRGGLLRHGSILTVTSYATRTSPVIRGHWILKNMLGSPPPPPPPDVPALEDNSVSADQPIRERLAEHRANAACAGCHNLMDPVGFALENYDAVGRWREMEAGRPVDASGGLPGGSVFTGVAGLERGLLERPELFVSTLAEKLLTFAVGRGTEHYDGPAIRAIVRRAEADQYRFSSVIMGIVSSTPFQMRRAE